MTIATGSGLVAGLLALSLATSSQLEGQQGRPNALEDAARVLTLDHYVPVRSTVPFMSGQTVQLYVRERVMAGTGLRSESFTGRVVLFVHGAGTPAEVAFDVAERDYSWMAFLARAGFDVFSVDMTGYGRSTHPTVMNDMCNLAPAEQSELMPVSLTATCAATYPHQLTTIASDWNDLSAAVDYILRLRNVERVSMVAWSLGGRRAGGYTALHPEKVDRLVFLAPAYAAGASASPPANLPVDGLPVNAQSYNAFVANWDRQVGCPAQYEPVVRESVWSAMLDSDRVGATWGPGIRRAPNTTSWGWNSATVAGMRTPTLLVSGIHDKQVAPTSVRQLYDDLGSPQKVFIDLACSSHNAMWEGNHLLLFQASLEWLTKGTVQGATTGVFQLGY